MNVLLFLIGTEWIVVLVIGVIFLLFGGTKLPQLAKALGQSKKAFKEGIEDSDRDERLKPDAHAKLDAVDDEALFEEARRRAQNMRAEESKKLEH